MDDLIQPRKPAKARSSPPNRSVYIVLTLNRPPRPLPLLPSGTASPLSRAPLCPPHHSLLRRPILATSGAYGRLVAHPHPPLAPLIPSLRLDSPVSAPEASSQDHPMARQHPDKQLHAQLRSFQTLTRAPPIGWRKGRRPTAPAGSAEPAAGSVEVTPRSRSSRRLAFSSVDGRQQKHARRT